MDGMLPVDSAWTSACLGIEPAAVLLIFALWTGPGLAAGLLAGLFSRQGKAATLIAAVAGAAGGIGSIYLLARLSGSSGFSAYGGLAVSGLSGLLLAAVALWLLRQRAH